MWAQVLLTAMTLTEGASFAFAQTSHTGQGDGMGQTAAGVLCPNPAKAHLRPSPKLCACWRLILTPIGQGSI